MPNRAVLEHVGGCGMKKIVAYLLTGTCILATAATAQAQDAPATPAPSVETPPAPADAGAPQDEIVVLGFGQARQVQTV